MTPTVIPLASLTALPPCLMRGYTACTALEAAELWRTRYHTEPRVVYEYTTPTIKIVTYWIEVERGE